MRQAWPVVVMIACSTRIAMAQPGETAPAPPPPADTPNVDEVIARLTSPEVKQFVGNTIHRARRAIAIGPTVGAWGGLLPSPGRGEGAITIGLGLEMFAVTVVPDLGDIKELVVERTKQKLEERIKSLKPPDRAELEKIAREVYAEVKAEVLGELNAPPQTFEKPRLTVALEGDRLFRSDVWQVRLRLGIGISRVTLGGTLAYGFGDKSLRVGPEIVGHALLSSGVRTPVVDAFIRYDFELEHRETNTDMIVIGARFLLDAI